MIVRKNQKEFVPGEWDTFISAVKTIQDVNAASPNYLSLARIHIPQFHRGTAHNVNSN